MESTFEDTLKQDSDGEWESAKIIELQYLPEFVTGQGIAHRRDLAPQF